MPIFGKQILITSPHLTSPSAFPPVAEEFGGNMHHQLNIQYPKSWLDVLHVTQKTFEEEAKMAMSAKLFEMKRLSSGMAARLAGVSRTYFLLNLHRYDVPMIDLDEDELLADIENA